MLRLFTSFLLEKQFVKLWQGSIGIYFITVQQILEKVRIEKTQFLLNLDVNIDGFSVDSCDKFG